MNDIVEKIKTIKEKDKIVAGSFCSFVPLEIMDAANIHMVNIGSKDNKNSTKAEVDLPANLCPLIKSSYGDALSSEENLINMVDLIIGEMSCDGKKKMYELLSEFKEMILLQLPQGTDRPYSAKMWESEVHYLIKSLEEKYSIEITESKLRSTVEVRNKLRTLYNELFELSKLQPPAIKGYDLYNRLDNYRFILDFDKEYELLDDYINRVKSDYNKGLRIVENDAKRILITGCPLGGVLDKIVGTIEDSGGVVVCYENCSGVKPIRNNIDSKSEDIVKAIADRYLNIGCSIMSPNKSRMILLEELIEEFNIEAVIEVTLQTCHPYTIEAREVKKLMSTLDIPYMTLETDYSESNIGQIKTRISAFIEMI